MTEWKPIKINFFHEWRLTKIKREDIYQYTWMWNNAVFSQRHLHDLIPFNIIICITVSVMSELTNM